MPVEKVAREVTETTVRVFHQLDQLGVSISVLWAMDEVGPRTMNFRDSLFKATQPGEL